MAMEIKIEEIEPYGSEVSTEKNLNEEDIKLFADDEQPVPGSLEIPDSSKKPVQDPETFKCPMLHCPKSFSSVDVLNNHFILMHSKPPSWRIRSDQSMAGTSASAENQDSSDTLFVYNSPENENCQNVEWPNPNGKRPKFSCRDCSFVGKDKNDIHKHRQNVHLTAKRLKCTQCDYVTNRPSSLKLHM